MPAYDDIEHRLGRAHDAAALTRAAVDEMAAYPQELVDDLAEEYEDIAEEYLGNVRDVVPERRNWQGYDLMNAFITADEDAVPDRWAAVSDWVEDAVTAHYGEEAGVQAPGMDEPVSTDEYAELVEQHALSDLLDRRHRYRDGAPREEVTIGDEAADATDTASSPA